MATTQKFYTGEKNESGQKLYYYNGNKVTSIYYTADIEKQIENYLNLCPNGRLADLNGVDFLDENGKKVQLKIMHNGKSSYTLPLLANAKHYDYNDDDSDIFRSSLWEYSKHFDKLIIYFGDSNIGTPFNPSSIVEITTQLAIYQTLYLRTYRGYAQNNNSQCQFNKTCKSDLTSEFLTKERAEKWLENVLKHTTFNNTDMHRVNYIKRKFFQFDNAQTFKS